MTGFDWRAQVEATPGDWVEFTQPTQPVATRHKPRPVRDRICTRDEQVAIARLYSDSGETVAAIATRYCVSPATVRRYVKGVR